jgi:hypothetical protein
MAHLAQGLGWKLPLIGCNGYADCRLLVYHQLNGLTIPLQLLLAKKNQPSWVVWLVPRIPVSNQAQKQVRDYPRLATPRRGFQYDVSYPPIHKKLFPNSYKNDGGLLYNSSHGWGTQPKTEIIKFVIFTEDVLYLLETNKEMIVQRLKKGLQNDIVRFLQWHYIRDKDFAWRKSLIQCPIGIGLLENFPSP